MRDPQRAQLNWDGTPGAASRLPQGATIHRGEVRTVFPSPEFPDPASADPEALLRHYLTTQWGRSEANMQRLGLRTRGRPDHTVGVHWTPSDGSIAHRFTEIGPKAQQGRPMEDWESRAIRTEELAETTSWRRSPVARSVHRALSDPERPFAFRELTAPRQHFGDNPASTAAAPYSMGVIWHGELDHSAVDLNQQVTKFESEIDLSPGSRLKIHGATLEIPSPGRIHSFAQGGGWQKVQFKDPIVAMIDRRRSADPQR